MNEESQFCIDEAKEGMDNALSHLEKELQKIHAGKASPQMLDGLKVDFYGAMTPLNQASNINVPDPRTIVIQPWDKNLLPEIEKAIQSANLGFNPQNDGELIRISVPPLTEERRKDLAKKAKNECENSKIAIRNIRRTSNDFAKGLEKDGTPEDEVKVLLKNIQDKTDSFIKNIDDILEIKEKEILTV